MHAGKIIKQARAGTGITQNELASAAHVSCQAIYYYESGRSEPSVSRFVDMMRALGYTPTQAWAKYEDQETPPSEGEAE